MVVFIDTGAWIARYLRRDQYHSQALKSWKHIAKRQERCFTSNFVLNETFTYLARRSGPGFAVDKARNIYASRDLVILRPIEEEELAALDFFEKFGDQQISFTDSVSFALMSKHRLKRAFTFDRHFSMAGFSTFP